MSRPIPLGVWPSNAPLMYREFAIEQFITYASITLLLYDHVLTFDKEVEWIWTLRWRLPKILFLIIRYLVSLLIILNTSMTHSTELTLCTVIVHLVSWIEALLFGTSGALIVIRVCALYGQSKFFVRVLRGFYAIYMIEIIVVASIETKKFQIFNLYLGMPGCWPLIPASYIYALWIPSAIFDGVTMILTLYKIFPFRNRTISMLARDSIVYFVIIFSVLMVDIITGHLQMPFGLTVPLKCITCIAVSRMAMNIRGLVMEDPDHTIHLQTLGTIKFASIGPDIHLRTFNPQDEPSAENLTTAPIEEVA